jgi:hypothetical protein
MSRAAHAVESKAVVRIEGDRSVARIEGDHFKPYQRCIE